MATKKPASTPKKSTTTAKKFDPYLIDDSGNMPKSPERLEQLRNDKELAKLKSPISKEDMAKINKFVSGGK